jgi:hypothetical protein
MAGGECCSKGTDARLANEVGQDKATGSFMSIDYRNRKIYVGQVHGEVIWMDRHARETLKGDQIYGWTAPR